MLLYHAIISKLILNVCNKVFIGIKKNILNTLFTNDKWCRITKFNGVVLNCSTFSTWNYKMKIFRKYNLVFYIIFQCVLAIIIKVS